MCLMCVKHEIFTELIILKGFHFLLDLLDFYYSACLFLSMDRIPSTGTNRWNRDVRGVHHQGSTKCGLISIYQI